MGVMRGAVPRMHASHRSKEAARAFPIKRGRRGGAAHLLNGAGAWSSRRPPPTITGWGEVTSPIASVLHARHMVLTRSGWRTVEAGNRAVMGRGSELVPVPCAFCVLIG